MEPICTPVKTYLKRSKRKRTNSEQIDSKSDTSSDKGSQLGATATSMNPPSRQAKGNNRPSNSASVKSIPANQISRKIDLREVPGPAPKRSRRKSDDASERSAPTPKTKKSAHMRTSSASINSLNQVKAAASSPSLNKAGSVRGNVVRSTVKLASKATSVSQSVGEDEDASVADSCADSIASASCGGRITRTVKDRQEYYKNQSDCHAFGPHRAVCSRCKQVVNLNKKQAYAVGPWERHRAKCDQELASDSPLPPNVEELVNAPFGEMSGDKRPHRTAAERRAVLIADQYIETAEEDRVKCAKCQKWVTLKKGQPYDLHKWNRHRSVCTLDSDRILSAERKLAIVNDPLVKSFDPTAIECSRCGTRVVSRSGQEYGLGAWEEHKSQCRAHSEKQTSDSTNSIPFPSKSSAKPPSSASTEVTVVSAEPAVSDTTSTPHSLKRPREEQGEEERPHNRARTETYEPPVKEPPSVLGWFMLPFRSFARGFRESLKSGPS